MSDNIFVLILCFTLIFFAFNSSFSFVSQESLFDSSDGHRQLYFSSLPDVYSYDDLWIDDNGVMYLCIDSYKGKFSSSDWRVLTDKDISNNLVYDFVFCFFEKDPYFDFEKQFDGRIEFWYQYKDPSLGWSSSNVYSVHDGDRWFDLGTGDIYEWYSGNWSEVRTSYGDSPVNFNDLFEFGYEVTVGTFEMLVTIFKGPEAFIARFSTWKTTLFGNYTLIDFIDQFDQPLIDYFNSLIDSSPALSNFKEFIEGLVSPIEEWLGKIFGKEETTS